MKRWAAVILLLLAAPLAVDAQQTGKVYRIGCILAAAPSEVGHLVKALDEGLRELGYVEGGTWCSNGGLRRGGTSVSRLLRRSLFS